VLAIGDRNACRAASLETSVGQQFLDLREQLRVRVPHAE
jgi:hypothetical protein